VFIGVLELVLELKLVPESDISIFVVIPVTGVRPGPGVVPRGCGGTRTGLGGLKSSDDDAAAALSATETGRGGLNSSGGQDT